MRWRISGSVISTVAAVAEVVVVAAVVELVVVELVVVVAVVVVVVAATCLVVATTCMTFFAKEGTTKEEEEGVSVDGERFRTEIIKVQLRDGMAAKTIKLTPRTVVDRVNPLRLRLFMEDDNAIVLVKGGVLVMEER